jgi:hypothetical protein
VKTKVEIDNRKLLARMQRLEEVTGKTVSSTLKRGARLLAVNLAFSSPPYGKNTDARAQGEQAVQNDILRVFTPGSGITTRQGRSTKSFAEDVQSFMTRDLRLRDAIVAAVRASDASTLNKILSNVPGYARFHATTSVDRDLHKRPRNAYGRVRKGWRSRDIVLGNALPQYLKEKQDLVGLTKASWASAALKVNADVKDALSGLPAWVKRHIARVPSAVIDKSDSMLPVVMITSKLPWADKAMPESKYKEAVRIQREKFFNSMGREIKAALKAEQMVTPTT